MSILIGIDDTDNYESRGTGFLARELGKAIELNGLGSVSGITRHQLFVDPRIPYTSQNSSACLEIQDGKYNELTGFVCDFVGKKSAVGSDAGVAICPYEKASSCIRGFGLDAKEKVVMKSMAENLASRNNIFLKGLTGEKIGVIGALAAVGLRADGNDGRFITLNGNIAIRDIGNETVSVKYLKEEADISGIKSFEGNDLKDDDIVYLHDWTRPVVKDGKPLLIVEKIENTHGYEWRSASKEYIKSIS